MLSTYAEKVNYDFVEWMKERELLDHRLERLGHNGDEDDEETEDYVITSH